MQLTDVLFVFGLVFLVGTKAQQEQLQEAASAVVEDLLKNSGNEKLTIDGNLRSSLVKAMENHQEKLKEAAELSGASNRKLANDFGRALAKDKRLQVALTGDVGETAPRFLGAMFMGVVRLVADLSTTFFNRYPPGV